MLAPRPQGCSVWLHANGRISAGLQTSYPANTAHCSQHCSVLLAPVTQSPSHHHLSPQSHLLPLQHSTVLSSEQPYSTAVSLNLKNVYFPKKFMIFMIQNMFFFGLQLGARFPEQSIPLILLINALFPHAQIIFLWIPDWIVMWYLVAKL